MTFPEKITGYNFEISGILVAMKKLTSQDWISHMHEWCDEADQISRHYFDSDNLSVEIKSDQSPVTIADQKIEETLIKSVLKSFPDMSILGEESEALKASQGEVNQEMVPGKEGTFRLIIDPIDATRNFVRGIPYVATLLGLEVDGVVVAGMVSSAIRNDRWWASKGNGSFYGGKQIKCSTIDALDESLALHSSLFGVESGKYNEQMFKLFSTTPRQRAFGDFYNHMIVANGCAEFAIDFGLKPWDVAPLKIIVEEAGGTLTSLNGENTIYESNIVSSNGVMHDTVLGYFK